MFVSFEGGSGVGVALPRVSAAGLISSCALNKFVFTCAPDTATPPPLGKRAINLMRSGLKLL